MTTPSYTAALLGALIVVVAMMVGLNRAPAAAQADNPKFAEKLKEIDAVAGRGPFKPDWQSLEAFQVPQWYQDGKFGIFIHWGAYSVPAFGSEWYPRNMYQQGSPEFKHHVDTYGPQSRFGYKDFIPLFKAEKFAPRQWARLFRDAGAKFVVPVAEHHDGFPMYDYTFTEWSAAKMGPGRDVINELAQAVGEERLVFGTSSHRAEHWWFFAPLCREAHNPRSNGRVSRHYCDCAPCRCSKPKLNSFFEQFAQGFPRQ
jgi:Alpha-L-fucosidase